MATDAKYIGDFIIKILITEPEYFPKNFFSELRKFGVVVSNRLDKKDLLTEISDTDILIIRVDTKIDKELIDNANKLKIIFSATTGLDHVDTKYADSKGIKILNPAGYATNAVAEHMFAMAMGLIRKIPWGFDSVVEGKWDRYKFLGSELHGKTFGIIGLGKIGKQIAKYASAFDMNVIAYDPYVTKEVAAENGVQLTDLENLISISDFITVNVALTDETKNMINKNIFNRMKRTAVILNTSRGAVINENDLVDALEKKIIAGAALDVFANEPLAADDLLIEYSKTHDNLLLTPHIGGSTQESIEDACKFILEKLRELQKPSS